ncbi:uncharacterized protein LOC133513351 isoform X2 [Syngnathoides biaculeatus]|uniref:uncharacterized protein LOC133513351 isoform X2 n=1 Tax=Syngnathoides biaculeatus TaxID=300417 RepID=UPI002ADDE60B|nr:uncharacterized protein LOC133513351 isoform X2 [Syngnathoides biaculeatus]
MGWGAPPGRTSSSCHEPAPTRISEPRSVTLWRRRRDVTGFTTRPLASPSRRRSGGFHGDHGCQSGGGPDASQLTDPRNSSLARAAGFWIPEGGHYSSKSICMYGWLLPLTAKTPARRGQAQRFYKDRLGSRDGGAEDERGAIYPRRIRRCVTEVWTVAAASCKHLKNPPGVSLMVMFSRAQLGRCTCTNSAATQRPPALFKRHAGGPQVTGLSVAVVHAVPGTLQRGKEGTQRGQAASNTSPTEPKAPLVGFGTAQQPH